MSSPPLPRRVTPLLFIGFLLAVLLLYARLGSQTAARGDRVLASLDPAIESMKKSGGFLLNWLWMNAGTVGKAVTALALGLGIAAIAAGRRRAVPIVLLLAGASLATWGQVLLWRDRLRPGIWLYLGAMACAAAVGVLRPLRSLPGDPQPPPLTWPAPETPAQREATPMGALEWAALCGLTLLGLLFRGYALTERPVFDGETVGILVGSYTGYGIRNYLMTEFLGTANGVFHVVTLHFLYRLFGATIFTIRLVALFWGVLAIPLLYWLARRIAGTWAAIIATVLFITAPEQLFWSRADNNFFAPVAAVTLLTAHLGLSMQERFAPRAALAAALWMPFSRYSYTPSFVLFTLPLLLAAHAAVFVRGALQRLWYVAPILLSGLVLWIFSLSFVEYSLQPERGWHFINPTIVKGEVPWRHAIVEGAGPLEVVRQQSVRVVRNTGAVLAGMTYHTQYTTHWYTRYFINENRNTVIGAGLAVLCALGIGYLLGQLPDRRAALLLIWLVIGLLPGCLSDEPEARRISIIFPALPIIAGVFVSTSSRLAREAGSRVASATTAALASATALAAFTALVSNLLLPTQPQRLHAEMLFARSLFERSDMVLHNLQEQRHEVGQIGPLDAIVRGRPGRCIQLVDEKDWPGAALAPRCDFNDLVFQLTLSPKERELRRGMYRPTRVAYLLRETPESRPHIDLLARLYPSARRRELKDSNPGDNLIAIEVPMAQIQGLRAPELTGATLRGSLFLPSDGWYRFRLPPGCADAKLVVANRPEPADAARPLLAGLYPFEATRLPAGCRSPFEVRAEETATAASHEKPLLLSPAMARQAPAPPVLAIPGWGDATTFARLPGQPADVGVDGQGTVYVLLRIGGAWEVHRFDKDGKAEGALRTGLPMGAPVSMAVDSQGTYALNGALDVEVHEGSGRLLASWKLPYDQPPSDIAFWRDGRVLLCLPQREMLQLFAREGKPGETLKLSEGDNPMASPTGVAVSADGRFLVVDGRGRAHLFQSPADHFAPERVATFSVGYPDVPFEPDLNGCAFDGLNRILFPHHLRSAPLVYTLEGQRVLAASPGRDLSKKGLQRASGFSADRDALYVIDADARAVLKVLRQ